jgi:uncharacterized cupin superfamily protein
MPLAAAPRIVRLDEPATPPVVDRPRADRLQAGNPRRQTWTLYASPVASGPALAAAADAAGGAAGDAAGDAVAAAAAAHISAGIWTCEVGRWRIAFPPDKHEVFCVLSGRVRLHDAAGNCTEVGPGESAVIPAGFQGAFEVCELVRKHFVIVEAPAPGTGA